jgi:DNA mismatch repair protein MutS2
LDVAARVGLPPAILALASSFLDPTARGVEDLLAGLELELGAARDARAQAEIDRAAASTELEQLHREREELKRLLRDADKSVRAEFEQEVRGYRAAVRGAMRQLKTERSERSVERARQRISEGATAVRAAMGELAPIPASPSSLDPSTLKAGDRVRVASLNKDATVVAAPDKRGRLQVDIGGMMVQVKVSDLLRPRAVAAPPKPKRAPPPALLANAEVVAASDASGAFRSPDNTLDLRGERVDEALERVDRFLDDASMRERGFVFLLHGHGTGALKSAIREHLTSSSYVGRWEGGTRSQGGDGITVVELR